VAEESPVPAEQPATVVPTATGPSDEELFAKITSPSWETQNAIDQLIARGRRDDVVAILRRRLREERGNGMFSSTVRELERIGAQPDYVRRTSTSPEIGPEDTDALELALELKNGNLVAHWTVHFGERLFGNQYPPYIEVSLSGGKLPNRIEKRYVPKPGTNRGSEVMLANAGPGDYAASVFLWSQQSNGTQVSDNASTVFFDLK
jgi:hypothetical protein